MEKKLVPLPDACAEIRILTYHRAWELILAGRVPSARRRGRAWLVDLDELRAIARKLAARSAVA
jgi:hypothetical protein